LESSNFADAAEKKKPPRNAILSTYPSQLCAEFRYADAARSRCYGFISIHSKQAAPLGINCRHDAVPLMSARGTGYDALLRLLRGAV
jgi:hypothetical protein